jgi:coproporphyrinogen III oxidase-like Fe-S oxidoreductase
MSLVEDLLTILLDYSAGYKIMRRNLGKPGYGGFSFGQKIKYQELKEQTIRTTLTRLKKRGLVENENKIWKITNRGREWLKNKLASKILHFKFLSSKK